MNERPARYAPVEARRQARRERVGELRGQGLGIREIAEELRVSTNTVQGDLHALRGEPVPLRAPRRRRPGLEPVTAPAGLPRPGIAFTAERGWHLVEAPPGWLLDLLAEVE